MVPVLFESCTFGSATKFFFCFFWKVKNWRTKKNEQILCLELNMFGTSFGASFGGRHVKTLETLGVEASFI